MLEKIEIVTTDSLEQTLQELQCHNQYGFDTETYGKRFEDRMFSLAIATDKTGYYFNFYKGLDHEQKQAPQEAQLQYSILRDLTEVFNEGEWFAHHAKFDLVRLKKEGPWFPKNVRCSLVNERLLDNEILPNKLSLDETAKRYGFKKDNSVENYIKENKLYETKQRGDGSEDKVPMYYRVPIEILAKYAVIDAWCSLEIGKRQNEKFAQIYS